MRRDMDLKKQRAVFVQKYINNHTNTTQAVQELTRKLFVSEATIYRDLTCTIKTGR